MIWWLLKMAGRLFVITIGAMAYVIGGLIFDPELFLEPFGKDEREEAKNILVYGVWS